MNNLTPNSFVLFPLISAAGMEAMMRKSDFIVDDSVPPTANSVDLLSAFSKKFPELWNPFLTLLELDGEAAFRNSDEFSNLEEPLPEPRIPKEDADEATKGVAKFEKKHRPPFTKPINDAVRQAMREAKDSKSSPSVGRLVQIMLSSDCNARQMLLSKKSVEVLDRAIAAIPSEPSTLPDSNSMIEGMQAGVKGLLDKTWPKLREVGITPRALEFNEKHYAENPDYYRGRVNLAEHLQRPALEEKYEFSQKSGGCLHAAQNEARIRNAPEVTLDHMFFSLLQPGLETTRFMAEKGVDWRKWREEMEDLIPNYKEEGPRFPPNARNLGMGFPEDRIRPVNPSLSDFEGDNRFEQWRDKVFEHEKIYRPRTFSDLLWVIPCFNEPETLAYCYLTGAGITVEEVKAETDSEY